MWENQLYNSKGRLYIPSSTFRVYNDIDKSAYSDLDISWEVLGLLSFYVLGDIMKNPDYEITVELLMNDYDLPFLKEEKKLAVFKYIFRRLYISIGHINFVIKRNPDNEFDILSIEYKPNPILLAW